MGGGGGNHLEIHVSHHLQLGPSNNEPTPPRVQRWEGEFHSVPNGGRAPLLAPPAVTFSVCQQFLWLSGAAGLPAPCSSSGSANPPRI